MGFLNFLNRRTSADAAFEHPFSRQAHQPTASPLPQSRGSNSGHGNGSRTMEEWQRSSSSWNSSRGVTITEITSGSATLKPRLVGITEGRPSSVPYDDESGDQQQQQQQQQPPKSSGRNPRDAIRGLTLTLTSSNGEKSRLSRDRAPTSTNLMSPLKIDPHPAVVPRRRSSAFVDILDAHGEIKACDFRSRVKASGSREYGEDVADRNIVENSIAQSAQLFSPSTGAPLPFRPRGSVSAASAYRSTHKTESILEESAFPAEDSDNRSLSIRSIRREGLSVRRTSAAISVKTSRAMSFDSTALEVSSPSTERTEDDLRRSRRKAKSPYGRVSVLGCRTTTPVRAPNTSAGPYMRDDSNSLDSHSRSASPPQVPRYKQRQFSLPTDQLPCRAMRGSVRHAREALQASALARERAATRCETPSQPSHQAQPHHKLENYYDWSRFNKSPFGEHLQPASQTWDDTSSVNSDDPQPFSVTSSSTVVQPRFDERERHAAVRTPQRQGSVSSFAPTTSDHSSPRFTGARSIRTAETSSIDIPHTSLFREMKFGGSSRSLRSRGGDSSIAPDCVGPEEDSCGDSIFISPATPVKEETDAHPLSGTHLESGFNAAGYESASIYDSDTESFREKRRQLRPDGEALLFRDKGFGSEGQALPGLFNNDMENLSPPKWPDMHITPTDAADMGDDEQSIMETMYHKPRQNSTRPFTQRERLLALGYDYDSESDAEGSVDPDEIPEERALMLLTALIEAGGSTSGKQGEQKLDLNTVAKLRREIRKRRRTGVVSRRGSRAPTTTDHRDGESQVATK